MKRSIAALALLAGCAMQPPPAPLAASVQVPVHVFDNENVHIKLMPGLCADARSLSMAIAGGDSYAGRWRAVESTWRIQDGSWREFAGCWLELSAEEAAAPGEVLVLIFDDGARYVVLKRDFLRQSRHRGA